MNLIQELLKRKLIDKKQANSLEYDFKVSGKREEELILEKKLVAEDLLFELKSELLKIPLKKILIDEVPLNILELIPQESAKYYQMIPLAKKEKVLEVGMIYPEDLKAQEALNFLARQGQFSYNIFLITPTTLNNLLKQYQNLKKEVKVALEELEGELELEKERRSSLGGGEGVGQVTEDAPITRVVAVMLRHAVEAKASDIHIEPGKKELRVRFRVNGILQANLLLPLKIHPAVVARVKILSSLKIDETRVPQDGRFSAKVGDKSIDFRVSTFPTVLGEKVVMRVLDSTDGVKKFENLGLEKRNLSVVEAATKKPYGMILATGPTGSGKTTTLYAILNLLNKEGVNIITLEDPVEYFIEGVNQSQIKPEIGYTFANGLRHILRQDPNVIMVGEIRDEETAALATQAALTGHIVLSTLHTNNALGVIPRLLDLKVAPFLIPSAVSVCLAQRLVRKLCPDCKKKVVPDSKIKEMIMHELETLPAEFKKDANLPKESEIMIFEPGECKKCKTGYTGRIALFEILEMTKELGEIVLKEPDEIKIQAEAKRQGMITMKQDGILKALAGITSIEEVLRVAENNN